jgi:histidine triad (HIT) family protein
MLQDMLRLRSYQKISMFYKPLILLLVIGSTMLLTTEAQSQSIEYAAKKINALAEKSVFEKIVDRELPATILFEDDEIMAFVPLRKQAPIHILIIPKKRIVSVNEIKDDDAELIGKMFIVARDLALEYKIDSTGYRLVLNTNEDAGQSVFHLHMHLIGGKKTGPITTQDYIDPRVKN